MAACKNCVIIFLYFLKYFLQKVNRVIVGYYISINTLSLRYFRAATLFLHCYFYVPG